MLRRAALYVSAAHNETYGRSLVEALRCGLPIVTMAASNLHVRHEDNGLLGADETQLAEQATLPHRQRHRHRHRHRLHLHPRLHLQLHPRLRLRLQLPTTTTTTITRCVACFAPSAALFRDFCRERAIAPPAYIPLCLASSSLASRRSATGVRMTLRATPQRSQPPPPPSPWHVRQSL